MRRCSSKGLLSVLALPKGMVGETAKSKRLADERNRRSEPPMRRLPRLFKLSGPERTWRTPFVAAVAVLGVVLLGIAVLVMNSGTSSDDSDSQTAGASQSTVLEANVAGVLVRIVNIEYFSTKTTLHLELKHPYLDSSRIGYLFLLNTADDVSADGFEQTGRIQTVHHRASDGIDRQEIALGAVEGLSQEVSFEIKRVCVLQDGNTPACEPRDGPWKFSWLPASGPGSPNPCGLPAGATGQPAFQTPGYLPPGYTKTEEDFQCSRSGGIAGMTTTYQAGQGSQRILQIFQDVKPGHDLDAEMKAAPATPISVGPGSGYKLTNEAGNKHSVIWSEGDIIVQVTSTNLPYQEVLRVAESMR
jgi:hypothetical protein